MEKVIERIRKMLALAGNNPSQEEADVAMSMALKLMAKHSLDMADVAEIDRDQVATFDFTDGNASPWRRTLVYAIAQLYFCDYYYSRIRMANGNDKVRHTFVGQEIHTATAASIAQWLIKITERKAIQGWKESGKQTGFKMSFTNAASNRIHYRVQEMILEAKEKGIEVEQESGSFALVPVIDLYISTELANKQWLAANVSLGKAKSRRASGSYNYDGAAAGTAHGNSVSLRRQVT